MNTAGARFLLACALASAIGANASPNLCGADEQDWPAERVRFGQAPIDSRVAADRPAGKHGFLEAIGESFAFADGTPARFFGVNVVAGAIFRSTDEEIDRHAERIARLGFNLVRLHHHDSSGWVRDSLIAPGETSRGIAPAALAKLDRWFARLRDQGVYVWLDLHTGRPFRAGDEIPGFGEVDGTKLRSGGTGQGFSYVNPRLEELILEFAVALLTHRNPWTKLRYVDDPALALVLITNENDLVSHFGNRLSAREHPWHRARLLALAAVFAARTGADIRQLEQTWAPGPARLFLAQIERHWAQRVRLRLRSAGLRVPITLTSFWSKESFAALAALGAEDFVDVHAYGSGLPLRADPRVRGGFIARIAAGQVAGRPLTVSEWNLAEPPQERRFDTPMWLAGVASLQGWDALVLYAYAQRALQKPGASSSYLSAGDPSIIALAPAAALAYRRGDISAAKRRFVVRLSRRDAFESDRRPEGSPAISTLVERSRVSVELPETSELPWAARAAISTDETVSDLDASFVPADAQRVSSDSGELQRDFSLGIAVIDTARTQAASGEIAHQQLRLSGVRIEARNHAAVAFSSLDGLPLERSRRVLVTVAARSCAVNGSAQRFRSEPVRGSAVLRGGFARVLTPLAPDGERGATIILARVGGASRLDLDFGSHWALIEPTASQSPAQ